MLAWQVARPGDTQSTSLDCRAVSFTPSWRDSYSSSLKPDMHAASPQPLSGVGSPATCSIHTTAAPRITTHTTRSALSLLQACRHEASRGPGRGNSGYERCLQRHARPIQRKLPARRPSDAPTMQPTLGARARLQSPSRGAPIGSRHEDTNDRDIIGPAGALKPPRPGHSHERPRRVLCLSRSVAPLALGLRLGRVKLCQPP